MSIPTENARRLRDLFAGHDEWHGTHGLPEWDEAKSKWGLRSTARTYEGCADVDMWQQHLDGERPLGVVAARLDEKDRTVCRWGCGDVDDYSVDPVVLVDKVITASYPLVPCRSKSGGMHLFLFLREWEECAAVQSVLRDMMASIGYAEAEIFPKQTRLVDRRDKGSWIVMPYFGGDYEGRLTRQCGVKPGGDDMAIEEFLAVAEGARTTTAEIKVQRAPRLSAARHGNGRTNSHALAPRVPFGDGPPCLEYLAENGVPPGGQNNALLMMGIYFKKAYPETWKALLERANAEYLSPPGSAEGLLSVVRSLEKKEYNYTCRAEPMRSFCNSRLCRGRAHGVGEASEVPRITHLVQWIEDEDEMWWAVQLQGIDTRLELTTQDFLEFRRFRLKAMSVPGGVCFAPMREADWSSMITAAMGTMEIQKMEEIPKEVKPGAKFKEMFQTYTGNRAVATTMVELGGMLGKPWQDAEGVWGAPGWWYLRLVGFMDMVYDKSRTIRWSRKYIIKEFRAIGGVRSDREINGREYSVWGFPPEAVQRALPRPVREHREEKI